MSGRTTAAGARLVIVGAGPRAIGVLERLVASANAPAAALLWNGAMRIDLIDPHLPGAGRIWRADESPLLLMNSRAADVTIFTDDASTIDGPVIAGPSLAEWAEQIRTGQIPAPTAGTLRLREIERVQPTSFVSRRVQALYLEWFFGQVLAALPGTIDVHVHRTSVTAVTSRGEGEGPWSVHLEDRPALEADLLLLAAGHTDARPDPRCHELAAFARRHGGAYIPPAQASDADIDTLAAGQDVIVRGMGLAFIDLMALLTEGRGGRFEPDPVTGSPGRLRYVPSGREPRLWVGSRRGVPYHSKVADESIPTGPQDLVHLTEENLRQRQDETGRLDFRADVLPLIAAEIARAVPDTPQPGPGEGPLTWLDDPLAWLEGDAEERVTRDAVVRHIEHDLRARTGSDVDSARALFQVLLRVHGALVELLPISRLRDGVEGEYPRWWHALFSFVDSGPPPHRLHQLLALERAGVVHFLGPRLDVRTDAATGRFRARGAGGTRVAATALVDAFLPGPALTDSANPLLRSLVRGGIGREAATAPGRLETGPDHRVVRPDGSPYRTLWAIGAWTSELPIGAFARPRTDAPCFRRNDQLARDLLRAAGDVAPVPMPQQPATDPVPPARLKYPVGPRPPRLGVIGTGKLGTALARTALRGGLEVAVTGRAPAASIRGAIPGAQVVDRADLALVAEVIVIAVPLHIALAIEPEHLAGAVVVDATNAWGALDEAALAAARAELAAPVVSHGGSPSAGAGPESGAAQTLSTSELLAAHLHQSTVVKTLNHIGYHDLEDDGRPVGAPDRRAMAMATDDPSAADAVGTVLQLMGFDGVHIGPLAQGRWLEPDGHLFRGWSTRSELEHAGRALARIA